MTTYDPPEPRPSTPSRGPSGGWMIREECPECDGSGYVKCDACDGDGLDYHPSTGYFPCEGCEGGKITCDKCHGSGEIEVEDCPEREVEA